MHAVSDQFLAACKRGGTVVAKIEAWLEGVRVELDTPDGNVPLLSGSVSDDASRPGVRRSLSLTTEARLWDALIEPGLRLKAFRGFRYIDGSTEYAPLGTFTVDSNSRKYSTGAQGSMSLTCPDLWALVQRARFEAPTYTNGQAVSEAIRLTRQAITPNPDYTSTATSTVDVSDQLWERDRAQAVVDIAKAGAFDIAFDADGDVLARDVPTVNDSPVWTVSSGELGVMLDAERSRSIAKVYNVVVVSGADVDGSPPFVPVTIADTNPTSPTRVSKLGRIPYFYSSPLFTSANQARTAGLVLFDRVRLPASQVSMEITPNPALQSGDVIAVALPDGSVEMHILDRVETPLTVDGSQSLVGRSTRGEDEVES